MNWVEIEGKEIPLLEAPQKHEEVPRRILYVLFKHRQMITVIFLAINIPMLLYLLFRPTKYLASVKVLIKPSRGFLSISPTSDGREPNAIGVEPSPEIINTEMQIIKSPELADRLVKDVPFPDTMRGKTPRTLTETEIVQEGRRMRGYIVPQPVRNSSLIEITVASAYPQEWTARVANRAAELYLEEHVKVHKTQGVQAFYDEQEKKLLNELSQAEDALKEFQQKENIIDAPQEVNADLKALATFDQNLKETDSAIRETEQKIAVLEGQIKQQKAMISSNTNITVNPVYLQMRTKLTQLELERDSLLQRYTPQDRLVQDKQKEIDELKKNLETIKPTSVGSENISINEVYRRILNELLGARVQLKALNEKKAALTRQVESYSTSAADKQKKGFEYDRLLRDVNAKKQSLDLYKKRAEEARISDAMDERKFSNAYILERASLPLPPANRSFLLLSALALIGAAGIAVAAAFAFELLDSTLRNETDIEDQIGLPVLATIQYYGDFRALPSK
ncbi:MAG: GumC family protein [Alphaproteobacteria bacterium]